MILSYLEGCLPPKYDAEARSNHVFRMSTEPYFLTRADKLLSEGICTWHIKRDPCWSAIVRVRHSSSESMHNSSRTRTQNYLLIMQAYLITAECRSFKSDVATVPESGHNCTYLLRMQTHIITGSF